MCLVVPIHGSIGKETTAPGLKAALRLAKKRKLDHVILDIDCPGGLVADANAMVAVLEEEGNGLTVHGVVTEAYSAAVWLLFECDHVWVREEGRSGAAVAFTSNPASGAIEVDKKLNAALAARMESKAASQRLPGPLFRAMVQMEAEVWRTRDDKGNYAFHRLRPEGDPTSERIDGPDTVVALSAAEMLQYGIAQPCPTAPSEKVRTSLAKFAGFGEVRDGSAAMRSGADDVRRKEAAVERARAKAQKALAVIPDQVRYIDERIEAAEAADPKRIDVWYKDSSGLLTPDSQIKWRETTDSAIATWQEVRAAIGELGEAERDARTALLTIERALKELDETRLVEVLQGEEYKQCDVETVDMSGKRSHANDEITRLKRNRTRYRIDQ